MTRLWEVDHPYYSSESNYYSNEPGERFESWADYLDCWGSNDLDLNLLFRWDWIKPDPSDYLSPADPEAVPGRHRHDVLGPPAGLPDRGNVHGRLA